MAFKPRTNTEEVEKYGIDLKTVDNVVSEQSETKTLYRERKTFLDQSIEVINILSEQGINIYDENRTPGMYTKAGKGSNKNNIKNFLVSKSKDSGTTSPTGKSIEKTKESGSKIPDSLFNFLTQNKKDK